MKDTAAGNELDDFRPSDRAGALHRFSRLIDIRIWWEDVAGERDVYDDGAGQAIGAGNIVVHTSK